MERFGFNIEDELFEAPKIIKNKIHLRSAQRNGRKCVTTVEGLPTELDIKKITKLFKKTFNCIGSISKDDDDLPVIQLSGDHREKIKRFIVSEDIAEAEDIIIH